MGRGTEMMNSGETRRQRYLRHKQKDKAERDGGVMSSSGSNLMTSHSSRGLQEAFCLQYERLGKDVRGRQR